MATINDFVIHLTTEEVNVVLQGLGNLPYNSSSNVINKLVSQVNAQVKREQEPVKVSETEPNMAIVED